MGCIQRCKEELVLSNFNLEYSDPDHFIRFEFGWPKLYLVWRGVIAVYHMTMIILTGFLGTETWTRTQDDTVKWFIYLTHWMFFTLTLCTVTEFVSVLYINLRRPDIMKGEAVNMPMYLRIVWVWQNLANNVSILVTILFWALLYKPGYPLTETDTLTHAGNVVYVAVNLLITASPIRFNHFIYSFISAIIYLVFSVIYTMAGGTNGRGRPYIYSVLSWSKHPGYAALYSVLSSCVGVPVVQLLLVVVFVLRVKMYERCKRPRPTEDAEMQSENSLPLMTPVQKPVENKNT